MPSGSGIDFIEKQRAGGCKVTQVAITSGLLRPADIEQAEALGCRLFEKPFDTNELLAWIDECAKDIDSDRSLAPWLLECAQLDE